MEVVRVKVLVYIYKAALIICYISYYRRILTETETQLITQKRFHELVEQQKKLDAEIDAQLSRQEDDLRLEEEVFHNDSYSLDSIKENNELKHKNCVSRRWQTEAKRSLFDTFSQPCISTKVVHRTPK